MNARYTREYTYTCTHEHTYTHTHTHRRRTQINTKVERWHRGHVPQPNCLRALNMTEAMRKVVHKQVTVFVRTTFTMHADKEQNQHIAYMCRQARTLMIQSQTHRQILMQQPANESHVSFVKLFVARSPESHMVR